MRTRVAMYLFIAGSRALQVSCRRSTASTKRMSIFQSLQRGLGKAFSTKTSDQTSDYYTIAITGSGGLVGTALKDELSKRATVNGKTRAQIINLKRGTTVAADIPPDQPEVSVTWNPKGTTAEETLDPAVTASLDAIVHLAGENVGTGRGPLGFLGIRPWSSAKKQEILDSRTVPTAALAAVVAQAPQPIVYCAASGVGAYGDQFIGDALDAVDESADITSTKGFLAHVSRQWEAATQAAKVGKNRVVNMRFGVVLSKKGGALEKLFPVFFMGGGGNVGSGKQYFSFISARDHARAIVHTLETPSLSGPVNYCAPQPCTNAEFTKALGKGLSRPTVLPFPSFAVKLIFGEMGQENAVRGEFVPFLQS